MTIIDAEGLIMGRLASTVAKKLLAGEKVEIVNAEKAVISGSKYTTMREYDETLRRGKPEFGPYFPKRPDRILKRTVRGMLPYKRARGRAAMANLKVYVGIPVELENKECIKIEEANMDRLSSNKYLKLGDLSKKLGAKF
ncbi:MAG: large subunit ribosomal protein [Methanolobus sp.]|jgi:large subunit ribosomal protein L13|uniref:Large ribosomal subunit protein uL13 n=1 Tax=Methanolobus tindarius DSM 2278 TaxID=1090322 RepID=W9DYV8_METTI|nr:50S ribosomal protein L13 [Methanolobus tindarius]ETA68907.1 LSU ribosomal protein L13P [Methanolobus tindarius DSM 2278]MDI3486419.1 large subunit ribosomal protein [Methanolobus sp.]MDK2938181.1 large subunit ribosomal protein [Methanolobus sp.]